MRHPALRGTAPLLPPLPPRRVPSLQLKLEELMMAKVHGARALPEYSPVMAAAALRGLCRAVILALVVVVVARVPFNRFAHLS